MLIPIVNQKSKSKPVDLAEPEVIIDPSGSITVSMEQETGVVQGGLYSKTVQLTTQEGKTVVPSELEQTAVASGVFTTGEVKVAAIPSNYEDVTEETTAYTTALGELESIIDSPGGGGANVSTCTVEVDFTECDQAYEDFHNVIVATILNNGVVERYYQNRLAPGVHTIENVLCNTVLYACGLLGSGVSGYSYENMEVLYESFGRNANSTCSITAPAGGTSKLRIYDAD